jgi:hypothetical protein
MVVAVVDEVIRDGVAVAGVELLHEGLGNLLLLFLDLLDEIGGLVGTEGMDVVTVEVDVLEVTQLINLILADGRLILLSIGDMKGLIHHVGVHPILRGCRYASMALGDPRMTAMDIGIGESRAGDPYGGPAAGSTKGVVSPTRANTEGCALLPKVPTNSGEEFDAASETKKTHGLCGVRVRGRWLTHEVFSLIIMGWNGYAVPFFCMVPDLLP